MRKALKIVSIIYLIALPLGIISYLIGASICLWAADNPDFYQNMTEAWQEETLYWTLVTAAILLYILAAAYIPAIVFTIIILIKSGKDPKPSKAELIVFGVLAFAFGSTAPGIMSVIWAFLHDEDQPVEAEVENVADVQ